MNERLYFAQTGSPADLGLSLSSAKAGPGPAAIHLLHEPQGRRRSQALTPGLEKWSRSGKGASVAYILANDLHRGPYVC